MKNINKLSLSAALACFIGTALISGCKTHQEKTIINPDKETEVRRPGINYQRPHSNDPETQERLMEEWVKKQRGASHADSVPNDTIKR